MAAMWLSHFELSSTGYLLFKLAKIELIELIDWIEQGVNLLLYLEVPGKFQAIKNPNIFMLGFFVLNSLAVTYFRMRRAYYHWRWFVSRPCSRWEGVVPNRYGRQA